MVQDRDVVYYRSLIGSNIWSIGSLHSQCRIKWGC